MDSNLSDRYNDGLVPPPEPAAEPARLQRPAWQPTSAQVEAARKQLGASIAIIFLVICGCSAVFALLLGWRP